MDERGGWMCWSMGLGDLTSGRIQGSGGRAESSPSFASWEGASGQVGEALGVQVCRKSPCTLGQPHPPSPASVSHR